MPVFGFENENVARTLRQAVDGGTLRQNNPQAQLLQPRIGSSRFFMATAKTTITAATLGTIGTDYTAGTGDAYLIALDSSTDLIGYLYNNDSDYVTKTVYNYHDQAIAIDNQVVFPITQDRLGKFWVSNLPQYKALCRFTLDAALATTDASKTAVAQSQYGTGYGGLTNITVYNLLTAVAGTYVFEGASGAAGLAYLDSGTDWRIIQMECP